MLRAETAAYHRLQGRYQAYAQAIDRALAGCEACGDQTMRETEVLRLLADGKTNAEIGAALFVSPTTASVHVTRILCKLGDQTRTHAPTVALRTGLLREK